MYYIKLYVHHLNEITASVVIPAQAQTKYLNSVLLGV